jgi:DNA-binding beta-propeller fold protein YncE
MQITFFSFMESKHAKLGSRNRFAGSRLIRVASLAILFLLLLAGSVTLVNAQTPVFTLKWGSRGSGNGQFENPCAVAVDGSGNVYVSDTYNNRVQKFTSTGTYLTQWGTQGGGNGQFYSPYGISVDATGNVYVVDTYNNRVQKFTSTGEYLTQFQAQGTGVVAGLYYPWGAAVDASGNLYVADSMNSRVIKFSSSGTQQGEMGQQGYGDGQFIYPRGVAVDGSGNVYVADSENHRVEKFSSTGAYLTQWGTKGSGNGQFSTPYGVAVDGSGNVYVLDMGNNRVQKFSSTLEYQTQWGSKGEGDGQFKDPWGFAVDSMGNVYVADSSNHRIQKFSASSITPSPSTAVTPSPIVETSTPTPTSSPKGPCIIATATYGGPLASEVVFMRSVRDDLIGSSPTGSVLVNAWNTFYYSWSPPVASAIADSGPLKTVFSALLAPLLGSMYIVAGVYNSIAWLSPDLAAGVSFMLAAALSIFIYVLVPTLAIRYGVKLSRKNRNTRFQPI